MLLIIATLAGLIVGFGLGVLSCCWMAGDR